jgi:hypothetical protein
MRRWSVIYHILFKMSSQVTWPFQLGKALRLEMSGGDAVKE